jgi:tRNA(fMet)-specific endonuclease VapC
MTIWILDTDHVSHLLQGNKVVSSRVNRVLPNLSITVVTVQEIFNGWIVKINGASESTDLVRLYTKLWTNLEFFKQVRVLNFDAEENKQLNKKRLQKDLRIAAIAISVNAVMVTRNKRDFSLIPGLVIEDWTE